MNHLINLSLPKGQSSKNIPYLLPLKFSSIIPSISYLVKSNSSADIFFISSKLSYALKEIVKIPTTPNLFFNFKP